MGVSVGGGWRWRGGGRHRLWGWDGPGGGRGNEGKVTEGERGGGCKEGENVKRGGRRGVGQRGMPGPGCAYNA